MFHAKSGDRQRDRRPESAALWRRPGQPRTSIRRFAGCAMLRAAPGAATFPVDRKNLLHDLPAEWKFFNRFSTSPLLLAHVLLLGAVRDNSRTDSTLGHARGLGTMAAASRSEDSARSASAHARRISDGNDFTKTWRLRRNSAEGIGISVGTVNNCTDMDQAASSSILFLCPFHASRSAANSSSFPRASTGLFLRRRHLQDLGRSTPKNEKVPHSPPSRSAWVGPNSS